jgi:hypothetical protein
MPKAGKYSYPEFDLDECIKRLRKVHQVAKQDIVKREVVADVLGLKPKSGWFNTLVGSMSQYGLVETKEGEVRITELAKIILYGQPNEIAKAKAQAIRNIELFNDLYNQYGLNLTDEQLRIFLRQKAYVDVSEVQSLAEKIGKLYKKVAQYLSSAEGVEPTLKVGQLSVKGEGIGLGERGLEEGVKPSVMLGKLTTMFGEIKITNKATLELARKLLDILESEISERKDASSGQEQRGFLTTFKAP